MKDQTTVLTRRFFLVSPELQRGDIIIYKKNNLGSVYVGWVIALPKESVRFNNGNLYIKNDTQDYKVEEAYLSKDSKTYANTVDGNTANWTNIGEFSYFVLPDKRENRFDTEDYLVNKNNIEGVVVLQL